MHSGLRSFLSIICFSIALFGQQDSHVNAREELNRGVVAYRAANYEEAVQHFENAIHFDPDLKMAHLYLATAYAQQYVPGIDAPENIQMANRALDQYAAVLRQEPANVTAMKGMAYLHLQEKNFTEAKQEYKKVTELDPGDPETWYSVGVVDWSIVYKDVETVKRTLKSHSENALLLSPACRNLRITELPNLEEGLAMLTQAIKLRPNYDDAMAYLNLLYRLRADLECGDKKSAAADRKKATEWTDQAMASRGKRADDAPKLERK